MGHSYFNVLIHVVFSTKDRRKLIGTDKQEELWKYMSGISRNLGMNMLAIGGMPDHVHLLMNLPGTIAISSGIKEIKTNSSKWMKSRVRGFSWQEGFGAFSVSASHRNKVIDYIRNQSDHHKKRTFEEEFLALLNAMGVEYDPEYVFG